MWKLFFILICSSIFICSCNSGKTIDGIFVPDMLISIANERFKVDYCALINKAINKDESSIRELALLQYEDGLAYEHGIVILSVIDKIGEGYFIDSLNGFSSEQKATVLLYVEAGMDLRNSQTMDFGKRVKDCYPRLFGYLTNQ